ncbi:MAG: hypothetical protein SFV15_03455 [Polyangiaceae bacterium]|nr:hypothetical protein [Polyangiaceae bacterium]
MVLPPRKLASLACLLSAWVAGSSSLGCDNPRRRFRQIVENAQVEVVPALAKLGTNPRERPFQAPPAAVGTVAQLTVQNQGRCSGAGDQVLPPGLTPLSVEVELLALSDFGIAVNRYYASLVDRDERRYPAVLSGCDPVFEAPPLTKGKTAKGWLNFVVPESVREFRLVYAPRLVDGSYAEGLDVRVTN